MNQLKAGAILNYVIIVLNTVVGLGYTPYMLRCLGQNDYGVYSLVASVITYLTILDFGFGNAVVRYTAQFRARGETRKQWEMFGMFVIVYLVIGLIAFLGGLGLYFNVETLFDRTMTVDDLAQARTMMLLLTVNLAFTFPMSIFGSIISAYENFVFSRVVNILRILLSTAVMIAVLAMGYKAVSLVVVQTVFNLATLVANWVFCRYRLKIKIIFGKFDWKFMKEIAIYSFWIFLNAIMDKIYWGTGQFVLGSMVGTVAVAIFSVAILLQHMYMQFSVSISSVLLPRVTAMVTHNNDHWAISDVFIRTGRIQNLIMSFILSAYIIFGQSFVDLWAGRDYAQSYEVTLLFFIALFIPLIQNTGIVILQARNQMKFRSLLYLVISIASLIGQIILARHYGVMGCAWSITIALLVGQGLIMNIYYATKQHIDIKQFWFEISKMLIVPAVLVVGGLMAGRIVDYGSWPIMIGGMVTFTLAFGALTWLFSLNSYERDLLGAPLRKLRR